jgi:phospholipid/cholesterol/gamma-HCH transport system permease protein
MAEAANQSPGIDLSRIDSKTLLIRLVGDWRQQSSLSLFETLKCELSSADPPAEVEFDTRDLKGWNTRLLAFLSGCVELCRDHQVSLRSEALPTGIQNLLRLAEAVPEKKDAQRKDQQAPFVERVGEQAIAAWGASMDLVTFMGESLLAFGRLLRGRAQMRWSDAFLVMQESGPNALGIVALINFLVGLILAFVGAVQLAQFGAAIYVADLVAVATVREMGCIMTAIIICGRTGAAFAAQLGTMKVNEEIDAFTTFGFPPSEFLVLPRMLALVLMMPLLVVFANLIAILGGYAVATSMLDVSSGQYITRTIESITLTSFSLGIFKGACFGAWVALVGCWRGMRCGTNAAAVGEATTSAVVIGITGIVAGDGLFAVLTNAIGI